MSQLLRVRLLSGWRPAALLAPPFILLDGFLVTRFPVVSVLVDVGLAAVAWFALRRDLAWLDLLALLFAGNLVLNYGFANISAGAGLPIPLVDVAAVFLLARAVATGRVVSARSAFGLACAYVAWATVRLTIDYPTWHGDALRDYSTAVEIGTILVGYWAVQRYGLDRFYRCLKWAMVATIAYLVLYPVRGSIQAISPQVGLQHPVALLGTFDGIGQGALSASLFLLILRPFGVWSYLFAATGFAYLAVLQQRGLYVAALAALFALSLLAPLGSRIRRRIIVGVAATVAVSLVVFAVAPTGRLGHTSPRFVVAQLRTLVGDTGPEVGTIQARQGFYHDTIAKLDARPYRWLVGDGLGPDLTDGLAGQTAGIPARKPHDDYLEALGRLGLLGLAFLAGTIVVSLIRIVRAARRAHGFEGRLLWWLASSGIVYALVAATQPLLAYSYGTVPLFLELGAGLALAEHVALTLPPTVARATGEVVFGAA